MYTGSLFAELFVVRIYKCQYRSITLSVNSVSIPVIFAIVLL